MTAAEPTPWTQPGDEAIAIDGDTALMTQQTLDALRDCTGALPKPLANGKKWKCRMRGEWWLGVYIVGQGVHWYRVQIA